jgi:hypothetical protein
MPTTKVMLYHNGQPITSKDAETLRRAYGQIAYSNHVTQKEKWKKATYATIWLEVHKRSLSKLEENDRTCIPSSSIKYSQAIRNYTNKTSNIPRNAHHAMTSKQTIIYQRAPIHDEQNWETTCSKLWERQWKNSTHIHAQEIILHGIKAAITQGIKIVEEEYLSFQPSGIIQTALREQNAIGWTNFYKGHMSKKWEQVQQQHYNRAKPKKSDTHWWATSIISGMWQGLLLMWKDWNDDQHRRDSIESAAKERATLLKKIHQLYTQKESINPEDRWLYQEKSEKIREWINLAEPLTKNTKKKIENKKSGPNSTTDKELLYSAKKWSITKNTPTYTQTPPSQNQDEE